MLYLQILWNIKRHNIRLNKVLSQDKLSVNGRPSRAAPPTVNGIDKQSENVVPQSSVRLGPQGHRPSFSEEDRRRKVERPRGPTGELNIFADLGESPKHRERRPRRNSETSIRDRTNKPSNVDAEKRRGERREKDGRRHGKPKSTSRRLDVIDKLDVTSIYGTGRKSNHSLASLQGSN